MSKKRIDRVKMFFSTDTGSLEDHINSWIYERELYDNNNGIGFRIIWMSFSSTDNTADVVIHYRMNDE